jgi:ABC-2 type transport system permease protein
MNKLLILARMLIRNGRNPIFQGGQVKKILFGLLITLAFLPIMVQIGVTAYKTMSLLAPMHLESAVLALGLAGAGFLIFVFGFFYVLGAFYFAQDVEPLLPLPFRPYQILGAKFLTVLIYEYVTEIVILVPILLAYGIHQHAGFVYGLSALLVLLIYPVIPLALASAILMVLMLPVRWSKNKDRFRTIVGVVGMAVALGINLFFQTQSKTGSAEHLAKTVQSASIDRVAAYFPPAKPAVTALSGTGMERIPALFILLGISMAFWIGFLWLGEKLYLTSAQNPGEVRAKKTSQTGFKIQSQPVFWTLVVKDNKLLLRTPVYVLNCVAINFIMPGMLVLMMVTGSNGQSRQFAAMVGQPQFGGILMAAILGMSLVITSLNAISSTALSREGKSLALAKAFPVGYPVQLLAKSSVGALWGALGAVLVMIAANVTMGIPVQSLFIGLVLIPPGIAFAVLSGTLIDLFFPKLNWDNETKAVKQNINVLIHMGICALAAGLWIWAVQALGWNQSQTIGRSLVVFLLLDAVLSGVILKWGAAAMERIEV